MNSTNTLKSELSQFIGTENYYEISKFHVITDGTKYLADEAQCYWLLVVVGSYLNSSCTEHFAVAHLVVNDTSGIFTLDDGNGNVFARQNIEYTDFPLNEIKLYCQNDGERWVIMLTSEY